jgi:cytoskeletal protein CcmA (bactofilin family)
MKSGLFIVAAVTSCVCINVFAGGCQTRGFVRGDSHYGKTICQNTKQQALSVFGDTELTKVTLGSLTVHGNLEAKQVSVSGNYNVHGNSHVKNFTVQGSTLAYGALETDGGQLSNVTLYGALKSDDTQFNGNLTLYARHIELEDAIVKKSIRVKGKRESRPRILCLEDNTVIHGDISFESGDGQIFKDGDAKVQGKVTGAKMMKGSCPI